MFNMEDIKILTEVEISSMKSSYCKSLINPQHLYGMGITGNGLVCAVIDTGCDMNHTSMKGKIIGGRNFTNEGNGKNDYQDLNGHGTHVAGLISSNAYKQFEGGIAPDAKLLICKALDCRGSGGISAIVNAINYAVDNNVDVINMSVGTTIDTPELYQTVKRAYDAGIILCCASGNESQGDNGHIDEFCYPGAYQEVIEVGAINKDKEPCNFSNSNNLVDCVCYGDNILSCYPKNQYALLSGTSQATPLVAGCVLLLEEWFIREFGRKPSNDELYATLIKCSNSIPEYSKKQIGFGYINLSNIK